MVKLICLIVLLSLIKNDRLFLIVNFRYRFDKA